LRGVGHVGQVEAGDEVAAVEVVAGRDLLEDAGDILEVEVGPGLAAEDQTGWKAAGAQENDDGDDTLSGVEFGQVALRPLVGL
jgi:hypothetical protein